MPSSNTTPYIMLAGVIVIAVATYLTVIQPLYQSVRTLRQDIAETQVKLTERENILHTLDQKIAALARHAKEEAQLDVVLPTSPETEEVVRILHQAAAASGGAVQRLNNVSPGLQSSTNARRSRAENVSLPREAQPLGFEVDFIGSYQQLRVFLGELTRAPRLLDIIRLEIQRNIQVPDSVTTHLTAQFYRYDPTKE